MPFRGHRVPQIDQFTALYIGSQAGNLKPDFSTSFLVKKGFQNYWNEAIYVEGKIQYVRAQLVLCGANKLGGTMLVPRYPLTYFA
jgi:hypothetical protein